MPSHRYWTVVAFTLAPLLLAACHSTNDAHALDGLDNELTSANAADPALKSALNDQIMVDPALTQQANGAAVRPPAKPYSAEVPPASTNVADAADIGKLMHAPAPKAGKDCPDCTAASGALTLGELASRQRSPQARDCAAKVHYSAAWAAKLGDLSIFPGGHVSEAAGTDARGCALRVVSFDTTAPSQRVIDYYYTTARKTGFTADQQTDGRKRVLAGTRTRDDGAFVVFVEPTDGGGAAVDLIVNDGR